MTQDLLDIADYLVEQIQDGCTGNEEHTYLILRVLSISCLLFIILEALFLGTPSFSFCTLIPSSAFQFRLLEILVEPGRN